MYIYIYIYIHTYTHTHTHTRMYIAICLLCLFIGAAAGPPSEPVQVFRPGLVKTYNKQH